VKKDTKSGPRFPLFKHARGQWAKKIKGRTFYFGKIADDPKGEAALRLLAEQGADLAAGRKPRPQRAGLTVAELLDQFLSAKEAARDAGEITAKHFSDLVTCCKLAAKVFGRTRSVADLGPDDFAELRKAIGAKRNSLATIGTEIVRIKAPFHWGHKNGLLSVPIRFGSGFSPPAKHRLRIEKAQKRIGWLFSPEEVTQLIDGAESPHMKAMLLLAINAALGPADLARLKFGNVDLKAGMLDFPRTKTGVARRAALWPETVAAIQASIAERPKPKAEADADTLFITKHGGAWISADGIVCAIPGEFGKLAARLGLRRRGRGLYSLRHLFRTVASGARDVEAIRHIMGHAGTHVEAVYLHQIGNERLKAVAEHVRQWLFGTAEGRAV
jgi:integrase